METVLLLATTEPDGTLGRPASEALSAAISASASLNAGAPVIGLIGERTQPAADALANCGASRFLAVTGPEFGVSRYGTDAAAAEALCRAAKATVVMAPATSRLNRVLAGVAHRLGGSADTHVTGFSVANGTLSVARWYYRQRMEAALQRAQRPWVLLLEPGTQPEWKGAAGKATVEAVAVEPGENCKRTTVLGIRAPAADAQTIRPDARLLFVAGAGWTKKQADGQPHVGDAEKLILEVLKLTRASLGSSKSLVDLGGEGHAVLKFLSHLNQVGQTGSTPRHAKGLATCCHGEEPHTVGWRFISERRAINLDANCGWARGKADVLYVADAFEVIKQVNAQLAAQP